MVNPEELFPIYIATKGRPGTAKTIEKLLAEGIIPELFVEPQEKPAYYNAYPDAKFHILPDSNRGVSFVRRAILAHARQNGVKWFWMMDDDVTGMYVARRGKCVREPFAAVLKAAQVHITAQPRVAVGALEYQQYSWSAKNLYKFNSYCDVCVLISVDRTQSIDYRDDVKEDRDFVLQALSSGWESMRVCKLAFSAPKNGSNKGGLHDDYAAGLENHWSANMVKLWPEVCEFHTKKDGRPDVKIHWSLFKKPAPSQP